LGGASYALYLTHTFIITPLLPLWIKFPIPADAIIAFGVTASVIFALRVHEFDRKTHSRQVGAPLAAEHGGVNHGRGVLVDEVFPSDTGIHGVQVARFSLSRSR
jgi:hypothetical protein